MAKRLDLLMKEDKNYKNKPTNKEPTVEEQLARLYGVNPLPTVSSPYKTQNVANMENYIGEQNIPQTPLNPQTSLNPQAELDKIMNYYGVGKTPGATPLSAYTPAPSAPTPVTTPSTNTDYSRNKNQNINTPVAPGQTDAPTSGTEDEFKKWYIDAQAKQDAINDEVTDTIKKLYSSKTEQEKSFYEQQLAMMQSQYEQNQQMLDQAKSQERREADILHSRMMKYLPEQMRSQGLSGLGISQSVLANAQNSLSSQLSDINQYYTQQAQMGNSEYQQNQMDLMQNYLSNQSKTDQSYEEALLDQYRNYADRTSALGSQQREERLLQEQYAREEDQNTRDTIIQPNMQSMLKFNTDGTITEESYNDAKAYIDGLDLPDALKKPLYAELEAYKSEKPAEKKQTGFTLAEKTVKVDDIGNNIALKDINGEKYTVENAGKVTDINVLSASDSYSSGDLFSYGGQLYLKYGPDVLSLKNSKDYILLYNFIMK